MGKSALVPLHPRYHAAYGNAPVYQEDIDLWLRAVPRMHPDSPRAAHYVRSYNVVGKISRAKLDGTLPDILHGSRRMLAI